MPDNNEKSFIKMDIGNVKQIDNSEELKGALLSVIESWEGLSMEIKSELTSNIKKIPDSVSQDELKELQKAYYVIKLLDEINQQIASGAEEMLKGAHFIIKDDGALYDMFKEYSEKRISSHHKGNKEGSDMSFQSDGIFNEVLFGKTKDGKTWVQLEAHSVGTLKGIPISSFKDMFSIKNLKETFSVLYEYVGEALLHLGDYIKYKSTGENVGQYGTSKHVDSNPIKWEDRIKDSKETPERQV